MSIERQKKKKSVYLDWRRKKKIVGKHVRGNGIKSSKEMTLVKNNEDTRKITSIIFLVVWKGRRGGGVVENELT